MRQTSRFVLDASVTLSWAFRDEEQAPAARARKVLESPDGGAMVPTLWWFEVRNILIVNERRGRITQEGTAYFMEQVAEMNIETAAIGDEVALLQVARRKNLSVYDAAYLAIAIQHKIPLATLDEKLRSAARSTNVMLLG